MLVIKYSKAYPASVISHIDLLRVTQRSMRRAGFDVKYSQGFNPHLLVFFSPALSLGIESECEFVTADVTEAPTDALERFNNASPNGITAVASYVTLKNPNFAGVVSSAEYLVKLSGIGKAVGGITDGKSYEIQYLEKGQPVSKEVRDMIFDVQVLDDDNVKLRIACGNTNLKIDRLVKHICRVNCLDYDQSFIKKTQMYVNDLTVDEYIKSID